MTDFNTLHRLKKRYSLDYYTGGATKTTHPVVVEWAKRVVTNGGASPSSNTISSLSTFMFGMDAAGLTSKVPVVNTFVPDNLIAAITPLLMNSSNAINPWTNHNFVAGDLTVNGLIGDGSSKYLDMGSSPSDFMTDGSASSIYYITNAGSIAYNVFGSATGIGRLRAGWTTTSGWGNYGESFSDSNLVLANNNTAWFQGYVCSSKSTTSLLTIYLANSSTPHYAAGTNTGTDGAGTNSPSNITTFVFTSNEGGAPAGWCTARLSFAALGMGLSATDSSNLYNLIQALRTSFGGGYI